MMKPLLVVNRQQDIAEVLIEITEQPRIASFVARPREQQNIGTYRSVVFPIVIATRRQKEAKTYQYQAQI